MDRTAGRIAGNVGCGGPLGVLFPPARFSETPGLQIGVCDHGHQGVTMEAMPGSALEVIEAEFLLELLPDIARIDFLLLGDSDRPLQAARVEPLADSFFPRSPWRGGGFAGRRRRSSS